MTRGNSRQRSARRSTPGQELLQLRIIPDDGTLAGGGSDGERRFRTASLEVPDQAQSGMQGQSTRSRKGSAHGRMAKGIGAVTLFVEDLETAKSFYERVFGLPVHFEDDDSAVFRFGSTLINLLKITAAGNSSSRRWWQIRRRVHACSSLSKWTMWTRSVPSCLSVGWSC